MGELAHFFTLNTSRMNLLSRTFIVAFFIGLGTFWILPAKAQEGQQGQDTNKAIRLPVERLKAFEGYFQFSLAKDQVIQFKLNGDTLVAKLLWNELTLHIVPESDSIFHNVELVEGRIVPLKFIGNGKGVFTQMYLADQNKPWERINDYKPLVRKEITHTPEQLKVFEGLYQGQGSFIRISEKENKLILKQLWDGNEFEFVPDSAMHFFSREQLRFTLEFFKGDDGSINRMVAFGRDRWDKAKKVSLTSGQVKGFEGKYKLKEDPDDIIQITASGLNLTIKQLWDGKEVAVKPLADLFFYNEAQGYSAAFNKDDSGSINGVLILNTDFFEKVKN
jgi:hypothetical protein